MRRYDAGMKPPKKQRPAAPGRERGFTVVEILFALAVSTVLITLAFPNFMGSVRKSRRAEALDALMQIQLEQERYRANHATYGSLAQLGIAATTSGGYYTLAVNAPTAAGYTATATAVAGKSQANDAASGASCATLTVNQDAPVYTPAGQSACWSR